LSARSPISCARDRVFSISGAGLLREWRTNAEEFMSRIAGLIAIAVLIIMPDVRSARGASSPIPTAPPSSTPSARPTQSANSNGGAAAPAASPSAGESKLQTMVVTATRIRQPASEIGTTVSVIDSGQIDSQKIQHVGTALEQVPGVQITQDGSPGTETDVSIRGSTAAQTLIMIDGVEANTGASGAFDISNLATDNIDQIEVLRGSGGSLYGSQAIGGVVNVISQEGEGAPHYTLLSEGGNRATQRQVLTVSGAEDKLSFSGALSYFSTEGFRPVNDGSDNLAGNVRLDYHLTDDTIIRGFARYSSSNVGLSNFSVANVPSISDNPTAHQRSEFMLFNGVIEHHFGKHLVATANAFFVRNEIRINEVPFAGFAGSEVDRIPDETRGGEINAVYTWAKGIRTLAGFDFKDRWARDFGSSVFPPSTTPSTTIFRARRQEYAGYIEQEASLFEGRLLATGGFRVDGNSQFGKEVSPSWSVAIPIKQISTTLRGSYSEGFRAPAFDELYFPGYGNPSLKPEVSSEYDGGFTTNFGELASLTTTYFSRRVHNLIVAVPCTFGPGCEFGALAGNAGRVDVQGVEVAPSITPMPGLSFGGSVTIIDETHVTLTSSAQPVRVPKHSAQALLQYARSNVFRAHDKITTSLAYTFVGDREDITTGGTIANHDAYSRFDMVASYALGAPWQWLTDEEVFTRVSNLLDRHYQAAFGFPSPPVNFVAGVQMDLQ
ncbi:MAG: TonB-dependent receptor, partial [Candidatus Binataceae bacterium]